MLRMKNIWKEFKYALENYMQYSDYGKKIYIMKALSFKN